MKFEQGRSLKEDLDFLLKKSIKHSTLLVEEVLEILSEKSRSLVLAFLSLPFCQPLQIPGLSTVFGIAIAFIGFRMAFGKRIWLPKSILSKEIPSSVIQKTVQTTIKIMNRMRRFLHPRLVCLCDHLVMKVINGLLIIFLGILLALPLPIPLTNFTVGWSIFFVSLGLLERDGVFLILGYSTFVFSVVFLFFMIFSINLFRLN